MLFIWLKGFRKKGLILLAYQVSVIGSFRKRYEEVVKTVTILREMGLSILSPIGSNICKSIEDFVIFETDNPEYSPEEIQMITLEKILNSDAVYLYNDIYQPLADELLAWECICLEGDMEKIIYDMAQDDIEIGEKYKQLSLFDVFDNL